MRNFKFLLISMFSISSTYAQITMDVGNQNSNWGSTSSVHVVDPATLGTKKVELINYSDIDGSPFQNQKWSKAYLFLKNGNLVKIEKMKLNMFSNEVDFINTNNVEMVLEAANFKKIVLMKQEDTSRVAAVFECYPDFTEENKGETFYRVLNEGEYQLYILDKALLKRGAFDPLLGKDPKSFYYKKFYAVKCAGIFNALKMMDKNNLLPLVKSHQAEEDWLNGQHNRLKNEKEIIAFFDYLNNKKN